MIAKKIILIALAIFAADLTHAQLTRVYSNPDYSVSYPAEWKVDSSKKFSAAVIFASPLDSTDDKFDESVNVVEQDLRNQKMDLEGYKKLSEEQMTKIAGEVKITKSVVEKTSAGDQYSMEYFWSLNGNDYHFKAICRIKNDIAYLVTLSTLANTFDRYNAVGSQILESFKIK